MAQQNSFIDGIGLTETNSLIHLLDNNHTDDNNEVPIIKHSAYYGENEFSTMLAYKAGLSILSGNIQSINAKFDDFQSFVTMVNTSHHISVVRRYQINTRTRETSQMQSPTNPEHLTYQCYMSTGVLVRRKGY